MKRRNLIIVAATYPYGFEDSFLQDELPILENEFEKIYIVIPESHLLNGADTINYFLPKNLVKILKLHIQYGFVQKLKSIAYLFKKDTFQEFSIIKNVYKLPLTLLKIKVLISFFNKGNDLKIVLNKLLKDENLVDEETILYSYWANEFTVGLAQMKHDNSKLKCFTRVHSGDLYFDRNTENYLPWRKYLHDHLDGIFSISESGKDYYISKLNLKSSNKMQVSRLGTAEQKFIEDCSAHKQINILTLAFLSRVKQIEKLIDALSTVKNVNINWTHIGGGHFDYEKLITEYSKEKLGNMANIKVEFLPNTKKKDVFIEIKKRNIHLLINTSKYEGIPVSMMEVLSMGIPVIGLNVGAVSEIVVKGKSGILLDAMATSAEIADAILFYAELSDLEFKDEKYKALEFWTNNYSAKNNYKKFATMLKSL